MAWLCLLAFFVLALAAIALAAPAPDPGAPSAPRCRFPAGETSVRVPLERGGDTLYVQASINGSDLYEFMIDTGASGSIVDPSLAERLRLPVIGRGLVGTALGAQMGRVYEISSLEMGGVAVENLDICALPREPTKTRIGSLRIGAIGGDFLGQMPFTLDYADPAIILHDPARFRPPEDALEQPLQFQLDGGFPFVAAKFGGQDERPVLLDTGFDAFLSLDDSAVRRDASVFIAKPDRYKVHDAAGSWTTGSVWRCDSFTVLGRTFRGVEVVSGPFPLFTGEIGMPAGIVGAACLKEFELTFNYAQKRIWIRPAISMEDWVILNDWELHITEGDFLGLTLLHRAASEGRTVHAGLFLAGGASVNATDVHGRTPMMSAAVSGRPEAFDVLVNAKADVTAKDESGHTVLHLAADRCSPETVKALLKWKMNASAPDDYGNTPLILAAPGGNVEIVEALVAAGADVNARTKNGATALMFAAQKGRVEAVKALLRLKADPAAQAADGGTALKEAALAGNVEIIEALVAAGAGVNTRAKDGVTALMAAVQEGRVEAVKALLRLKADPGAQAAGGGTALMFAAVAGNVEIIEALAAAGADVNAKMENGATALMVAAGKGRGEAVKALLRLKADPGARGPDGHTALTLGALAGNVRIIEALVAAGAHVNAKTKAGETALSIAKAAGKDTVVAALKKAGAKE